jgi:AraC family transcriptional regulator of adaptative response / DNA-3-methyladenine glycosylase II
MELDPEICERARQARDPRFDGRFFIGVRTTGIYCRPICRVRPPLRRNIDFYPSAPAAEEAGFRPCRRCRPETAPGTPAWRGSSATVERALRMIDDGALDREGVPALADRLGIGPRHLRRLFLEHVGAPPLSVARTRRAHFARRLIDESKLPMVEVAAASGFGSVRQFNDAIRATFHRTPSEIRGAARGERTESGLTLTLPFRPPFDWAQLLGFLVPRAMPGVEAISDGRYLRAVGERTFVEIAPAAELDALELHVRGEAPGDLITLAARARKLFDLSADPDRIAADLSHDRRLRRWMRRWPGLRVPGAWDPFEIGVRAILGQQVSVVGATTMAGRLVRAFGKPTALECTGSLTHLFPSPARLAEADVASIGLPRARGEAIRGFAAAIASGDLVLDGSAALDESLDALRALPGFGDWTAQYVAMRALGEPDAFPAGDLGLRKALSKDEKPAPEREVRNTASAWRPWRSYAALWLWTSLSVTPRPVSTPARRKSA